MTEWDQALAQGIPMVEPMAMDNPKRRSMHSAKAQEPAKHVPRRNR